MTEKEEPIYKPKHCKDCCVVKIEKKNLICGCFRKLRASLDNYNEQKDMWDKCPIDWDK